MYSEFDFGIMNWYRFYTFWFILFIWTSCSTKRDNLPDVSTIDINVNVIRYDQLLNKITSDNGKKVLNEWKTRYPAFNEIYFSRVMNLGSDEPENIVPQILNFMQDSALGKLFKLVDSVYMDISDLEIGFKSAFQYYRYYFPERSIPELFTFVSAFGIANFVFESASGNDGLGIGLDFFLGDRIQYKNIDPTNPSFSDYLTRSFNREHLVKKTIHALAEDIVEPMGEGRMLDVMINEGKKLYFLKNILPETHDTVIHEYTSRELEWCEQNELEIWAYFIEQDILYSNDLIKFRSYVYPSPHSAGMPEEAPGRTANFIALKIIEKYVGSINVGFPEILTIPAEEILNKSRYKPRKR